MKLWPVRTESKPIKIIADIDAIISEPVGFIFQGQTYEIHPVDTESFMRVANSLHEVQRILQDRGQGKSIDEEEVYQAYLKFIQPLCPRIGLKELKAMKLPQIDALVNLIFKHIRGDTTQSKTEQEETDEKKKKS